ncbi:hypothetical protein AcV5_008220 [Taiwanofungus camphoratus]|nr:hypothetical protein AcV5_008220 [Antrodia cinnamomea]
MSASQKALLLTSKQGRFAVGTVGVPKPGSGELLIRIQATALNPVDWKIQTNGIIVDTFPAVLGFDYSGTVEEVGEGVTGFTKGDRIFTQGLLERDRASFQQFTLANADVTAKIPPSVSFEQAATIPVGLATAAFGLFNQQVESGSAGLCPPWEDGGRGKYVGKPLVIFGGSTSVGQFAIQLGKLAGFSPIIATASPHNTTFLVSLGATHVLDRRLSSEAIREEVSKITPLPIETIFDGASLPDTQDAAYDLLAPGGCLVLVLFEKIDEAKKTKDKRVEKAWGQVNAPENRAVGAGLYKKLPALLEEGAIRPNRVEIVPNGLEGIINGLEKLKNNEVSGVKLVAHPQETA